MCRRAGAPRAPGLPPKGILIDSLGHCAIVGAAIVYFLLFLVAIIVGVLGPSTFSSASNSAADLPVNCGGVNPSACVATWTGTLTVRCGGAGGVGGVGWVLARAAWGGEVSRSRYWLRRERELLAS